MSRRRQTFLCIRRANCSTSQIVLHSMGQVMTIDELKSKMKRLWKRAAPVDREWSVDGQHGSNLAHKVKNMRTSGRVGSVDGADASTHSHDSTIENHSSNPHSLIEKLKDYGAGNPNYTSFTDVDLSSSGPGSNRGQHSSSASKSSSAAATSAEPLCQTCRRVECMRDRSPFDMCKFQHVQVRHDDRRRGRE